MIGEQSLKKNWKNSFVMITAAAIFFNTTMISRANGWLETEKGWYYEEDGETITSAWKKGDAGYYYLGESGKLSTASWIYDGDENYYVDSEGLRVKNIWINTESWDDPSDHNQYWYYFDRNGEMMTGKQQIGDKKYFFSDTGRMLTGWVIYSDGEAETLTDEINSDDTYYCLEDGSRASGWLKLAPPADEEHTGYEYWYYFQSSGKLRRNSTASIGENEFCFDNEGRMMSGWVYKTADTDTYVKVDENTNQTLLDQYNEDTGNYIYCGAKDIGVIQKDIWLSIVPPGLEGDPDEGEIWYYFDKKGKIMTASNAPASLASASNARRVTEVRTVETTGKYGLAGGANDLLQVRIEEINNKPYLFDNKGHIVDGLVYIYNRDGSFKLKEGYYYFGSDSAKTTGRVLLEDDGTEYEYYFSKKREKGYSEGQGVTGIVNGRLYYHGLAVVADEEVKYKLISIPELAGGNGTGLFVVDENGKVKTGGITSEIKDGYKFRIKKDGKKSNTGFFVYQVERGLEEEVLLTGEDAHITFQITEPDLIN